MKRVSLLVGCLLLLTAVTLSATGTTEKSESAEPTTITFAAVAETGTVLEARDRVLERFGRSYPNIRVEREELPHSQFWVKIPAEIAAGNAPDVIMLPYLEQAVTFAAKGMLAPLDSYMTGAKGLDMDDWYPEVLKLGSYGGKQMVLPQALMVTGLGYNKELFDEAGVGYPSDEWTWEDMLAAAKKLTLDADGNNAESPGFDPEKIVRWGIYTWWWNSDFALYLWSFGGDWLDESGSKSLLDRPEAIDALSFYGDLTQKYHVAPYMRELAPAHGHPALMERKVAMAFIDIGNIKLVDESGIDWGMSVVPYKKEVGRRAAFLYGNGVAILERSNKKETAWELEKFLASEWDDQLAQTGYGFPPTRSAMERMKGGANLSEKILPLLKMYEGGWTRAIRATDYSGMVVTPCTTIMESVLSKTGTQPDYAAVMKQAAQQCNQAIGDAPKLEQ